MQESELKHYLSDKYQGWESFRDNVVLPIFGEEDYEDNYETEMLDNMPECRRLADATGIKSIKQCASFKINREPLLIFDITVADRIMMKRNRVGVQTLIRSVMEHYSGAFMIFHYEEENCWQWRFSFSYKGTNDEESTDRKRYTFLLGQGQSCRTAAINFCELYKERIGNRLQFSNIIDAFSVEALSDEFFDGYKAIYADIIFYITGKRMVKKGNKWEEVKEGNACRKILDEFSDFADPEKAVRDYVKKLMGRLVFLQFLQKKGWLGVPLNEDWGNGDHEFIQKLFANTKDKDNFVDGVLEAIFNDLNTEREGDKSKKYKFKIPYLNGGLFERDATDETNFPLPAEYIERMLDFFSQYNFTIDENDPNDAEVGVDPEMLGRIFENLLEDNKDKGAFYTPKEIVQYMCRESLIAYLQTGIENEAIKEDIRRFVTTHDVKYLGTNKNGIQQVDEALKEVKICDPAIGSGAFPMGLLKELYQCRSAIEGIHEDKASEIKKHIIQHNIYGVDIEKGAVDIARLRFWLSLIVDEKTPQALPNLDFKIMQGNSLLEQYKGVDLSNVVEKKREGTLDMYDDIVDVLRLDLRNLLAKYYDCTDHKEKKKLRKEITDNVKQQLSEQGITINFGDLDLAGNDQFFLWHTWFYDVFSQGGFDIVIGNPPYFVYQENHVGEIKELRNVKDYKIAFGGKLNAYKLFIANALSILCRKEGVMCIICQNSLLADRQATNLRKHIFEHAQFISIDSFPERDSKKKRVFESVKMSVCIPIVRKRKTKEYFHVYIWDDKNKSSGLQTKFNYDEIKSMDSVDLAIPRLNSEYTPIVIKIIRSKEVDLKCIEGELNMTFHKGYFTNNISNPKILKGASIQRYYYTLQMSQGEIEYLDEVRYLKDYGKSDKSKHHNDMRIAMQGMTGANDKIRIVMALIPKGYYLANSCNYLFAPNGLDIYALLGILNSKLINWFFRCFSTNSNVNGYEIDNLPIPSIDIDTQLKLKELVVSVMKQKSIDNHADTQNEESKIDEIVYQLYNLSKDEIRIIEK